MPPHCSNLIVNHSFIWPNTFCPWALLILFALWKACPFHACKNPLLKLHSLGLFQQPSLIYPFMSTKLQYIIFLCSTFHIHPCFIKYLYVCLFLTSRFSTYSSKKCLTIILISTRAPQSSSFATNIHSSVDGMYERTDSRIRQMKASVT